MTAPPPPDALRRLADLVGKLRAEDGCPWDREQKLEDLRAYLLEEAHEVAAAIDRASWPDIAVELGDLLFLVAFIGRLGEEAGELRLDEVAAAAERKIVGRHPHVFGDVELADAAAVRSFWERSKSRNGDGGSHLSGVAESLPALVGAYRLGQKAAGVGFDWTAPGAVMGKVEEELAEVRAAMAEGDGGGEAVREEIGDLLFAIASLARHLGLDPEAALAAANLKFRRRFAALEERLAASGGELAESTAGELEELWAEVKAEG